MIPTYFCLHLLLSISLCNEIKKVIIFDVSQERKSSQTLTDIKHRMERRSYFPTHSVMLESDKMNNRIEIFVSYFRFIFFCFDLWISGKCNNGLWPIFMFFSAISFMTSNESQFIIAVHSGHYRLNFTFHKYVFHRRWRNWLHFYFRNKDFFKLKMFSTCTGV